MGQLNIKDDVLIAKAKQMADRLGTSTTGAFRVAVDDWLARDEAGKEAARRAKFDAITAIAERASKLFPPGTTSDHSDLYDEDGLPK